MLRELRRRGRDALGSADGYVGHRVAFFLAATLLAGAYRFGRAANSGWW